MAAISKVTYTDNKNFALPGWIELKQVQILKKTFLVTYEAEVIDTKSGPYKTLLRLEYPKRLLPKFKRHFNLE